MIYITGDTHGQFYRIESFCKQNHTVKEDIMIILGDAGINYSMNTFDKKLKDMLKKIPITFLCIHGNHEQRPEEIDSYEEIEWNGGIVYSEKKYPSILFAKDGQVYDFEGKKAIAIGGAYSIDKFYRLSRSLPWYNNEQPSDKIKEEVEKQLNRYQWKMDLVLSHTVPLKYEPREVFLPYIAQAFVDKATEMWLDEIEENLEYKHWYAGHYHTEKKVDNLHIMFEDIEKLFV